VRLDGSGTGFGPCGLNRCFGVSFLSDDAIHADFDYEYDDGWDFQGPGWEDYEDDEDDDEEDEVSDSDAANDPEEVALPPLHPSSPAKAPTSPIDPLADETLVEEEPTSNTNSLVTLGHEVAAPPIFGTGAADDPYRLSPVVDKLATDFYLDGQGIAHMIDSFGEFTLSDLDIQPAGYPALSWNNYYSFVV